MGLVPGNTPKRLENFEGEIIQKKQLNIDIPSGKLDLENNTVKMSYLMDSLLESLISQGVQFPFRRDQLKAGVCRRVMTNKDTGQVVWIFVEGRHPTGQGLRWDIPDLPSLLNHLKDYAGGSQDIHQDKELHSIPHATLVVRRDQAEKINSSFVQTREGQSLLKALTRGLMQFSTSHTEQIVQTEFLSTTDLTIREVSN
jgi:hypothetical protein